MVGDKVRFGYKWVGRDEFSLCEKTTGTIWEKNYSDQNATSEGHLDIVRQPERDSGIEILVWTRILCKEDTLFPLHVELAISVSFCVMMKILRIGLLKKEGFEKA